METKYLSILDYSDGITYVYTWTMALDEVDDFIKNQTDHDIDNIEYMVCTGLSINI